MSETTHLSCAHCGGEFVVDVFKLGHSEHDGLDCVCCGREILSKQRRTQAYTIIKVSRHGNLAPKLIEVSKHVGKRLRFARGEAHVFVGVVSGISEAVEGSAKGPIRPWAIECDSGEVGINPESGWNVCLCQRE